MRKIEYSATPKMVCSIDENAGTCNVSDIIQWLPLSEGDMTICSPDAGHIARGLRPRAI